MRRIDTINIKRWIRFGVTFFLRLVEDIIKLTPCLFLLDVGKVKRKNEVMLKCE